MSKVYISGPISNMPDGNKDAFLDAEEIINSAGHVAVNPINNGLEANATWAEHMRADIKMLLDCDRIYMLPNWDKSTGANVEHALAVLLKFDVEYA